MQGDTGQFRVRRSTIVGLPPPIDAWAQPRRARRFAAILEVHFRSDAEFVREHATNMASGGIFVPTTQCPPIDSEVLLTVRLPNGDVLQSPACVVQFTERPVVGVCLSFAGMEPAFEAAIHAYLLSLARRRS